MGSSAADLPSGPSSREAYRQRAETQPHGRFERIDGQVIAMTPERASHAERKALIWLILRQVIAANGIPCHVYPNEMTIEVGDGTDFEPDAVLHCGEPLQGDAITVPDPLIEIEVLFPSTRAVDLPKKLIGYFKVPSVRHYLILFADRPQVIHHRRRGDSDELYIRILTAGAIVLDPPGIVMTVEDVYGT